MINFYKDKASKWRWRIVGKNGEIIGASTQGFFTRRYAEKNLALLVTVYNSWNAG